MANKIRVTVWNEYRHELNEEAIRNIYPEGIHGAVKAILEETGEFEVRTATLDMPEHGLSDEVLENTDVLVWWGHLAHKAVDDKIVSKIRERVYRYGMGFVPLHSAHHSKPFTSIIGCTGDLSWGADQKEIVWNVAPYHPITDGIPDCFELFEEMYGEPFYIPQPDQLLFSSWFEQGNVFRSGCCYYRGLGKIFYFQPGHEACRSFYNPYVRRIIQNGVRWAAPTVFSGTYPQTGCIHQKTPIVEELKNK
ncbi:MAG: ThuA domain-containing protein [Clostridia bacterium]|nr:ThuA domain-containing protein [Clostridia bacterium]